MKYIDAIIHFCEKNNLDVESVPKLISKPLKEKIKYEGYGDESSQENITCETPVMIPKVTDYEVYKKLIWVYHDTLQQRVMITTNIVGKSRDVVSPEFL